MNSPARSVVVFAFGLISMLYGVALGGPATSDPWTRVPAFPTGCYEGEDGFAEKLGAVRESVQHDITEQEQVNDQVSQRLAKIDPMERMRKMQEFMMQHPQEAAAMLQRTQAAGTAASDGTVRSEETRKRMMEDLDALDARYKVELGKATDPFDAKFKELDARAQKDLVVVGESYAYAPWAVKEYNALTQQANAAYEKLCGSWWGAAGPYTTWLNRYRDHIVKEDIPVYEEIDAAGVDVMAPMLDSPTASHKSTATLHGVRDYLEQVSAVYGRRNRWPRKTM